MEERGEESTELNLHMRKKADGDWAARRTKDKVEKMFSQLAEEDCIQL